MKSIKLLQEVRAMKKLTLLGLGSIFLFAGNSKAEFLIDFEAAIGLIQQKPRGYVSYEPIQDADKIDVKDDAHLGDKTKPRVKLKLEHSVPVVPNIKLAYVPMKFDGSGVLTRDINWGGNTYQANADSNLSVKLDRVDTTLYYNLPFVKTATAGKLDVELGLNVRTIMFDGKLSGTEKNTGESISESKSITLPIPMGHLAVEVRPISQVSLVGELNYISYSKNTYYDYAVGLRLNSHGFVQTKLKPFVEVGYRYEKLKLDEESVKADLKVKGSYALVGVRF
jgi:outer membrane protein